MENSPHVTVSLHRVTSEETSNTYPASTSTEKSASLPLAYHSQSVDPSQPISSKHRLSEGSKETLKMQLDRNDDDTLEAGRRGSKTHTISPILINKNPYRDIKSPHIFMEEDSSSTSEMDDFDNEPSSNNLSESEGRQTRISTAKSTGPSCATEFLPPYRVWSSPVGRVLIDQTPKTPIHTMEGATSSTGGSVKSRFIKPPKVYHVDALGLDELATANQALKGYLFCDIPGNYRVRKQPTEIFKEDPHTGKLIRVNRVNERTKLPRNYARTLRYLSSQVNADTLWGNPLLPSGAGLKSEVSGEAMIHPPVRRQGPVETRDFGIQYPPIRPRNVRDLTRFTHESVYGGVPVEQVQTFCLNARPAGTEVGNGNNWEPSFSSPSLPEERFEQGVKSSRIVAMSKHHILTADTETCGFDMQPLIYSSKPKIAKEMAQKSSQIMQPTKPATRSEKKSANKTSQSEKSQRMRKNQCPVKITSEYELGLFLAHLASASKMPESGSSRISHKKSFSRKQRNTESSADVVMKESKESIAE